MEESPVSVPEKSEGSDVSTGSFEEEKTSKSPDMEVEILMEMETLMEMV